MSSRFASKLLLLPLVVLPLTVSCSDDDDDNGGGAPLQAGLDVLIRDAAVNDLLAFTAEIQSVRLRQQGVGFTENLLAGPITVEFLGLDDTSVFIAHGDVPTGIYESIEIAFTPGAYTARARNGTPVTITAADDVFMTPFAAPLDFDFEAGEYARVQVDLDLRDGLSGDVGGGTLAFEPSAVVILDDGDDRTNVEEFKALVTSSEEGAGTVDATAFADDEMDVTLGTVTVEISDTTLFLDENNAGLSAPEFFDALSDNQTLIEVAGDLGPRGVVEAQRVEIKDQTGGAGSADLVRIEGVVVFETVNTFTMRVREVEEGVALAQPIIDALTTPETIDVSFDAGTIFVAGDETVDPEAVLIGSEVKVEYCAFATEPFPACLVQITDTTPEFHAVVTNIGGMPDSFIAHMVPDDPALAGGLVTSPLTDVVVDVDTLVFDMDGSPAFDPDDLALLQEVELEGTFSGPPVSPTLNQTSVSVRPGFLDDALVTSSDENAGTFFTQGGEIVDPFGSTVQPGTLLVRLQSDTAISGDVDTRAELFTLLEGPQRLSTAIDVIGIGTGVANEIRAFAVKADITPGDEPFPQPPEDEKVRRLSEEVPPEATIESGG